MNARRWPLVACCVGALLRGFVPDAVADHSHAAGELPKLTAPQVFALADIALQAGEISVAETAYRALANDLELSVRNEARFRLAMVYMRLGRYSDAETLYREILHEEPAAVRTRLERARALDLLGDNAGAVDELRSARATGLPPEVDRGVEYYASVLRTREPFGFSFNVALAPDSNINRATRSHRLQTTIGELELDADARERSGIGLALSGQAHARIRLAEKLNLVGRTFASGNLYRSGQFNDTSLGVAAGPEFRIGDDYLNLEIGQTWREYGGALYSQVSTLTLSEVHPVSRQARLRASFALGLIDNERNDLQDGHSYAFGLNYERDLSQSRAAGIWLHHDRQRLRDPGYATTFNEVGIYGYQQFRGSKVLGSISYGRLEGDERLAIYPRKRDEDLFQASLSITLQRFEVLGFLPYVHLRATRNHSSIDLYDFDRLRVEFALTRAY